ncbi:peptide deformylase [Patescibacteria group bacterium]|nr:peptide deformylase [Patescibacteria group bacterium]MBU4452784.1 peptide deformylase [Patescibacteria group bacterium]MCG2687207.1 peptide deformylase [Candidatus Parcubacteria bacterium]
MKLEVLTMPNNFLREVSQEITQEQLKQKDVQNFFDNMIDTMFTDNGVGIAAPQVGKHWRVIVVTRDNGPEIFVNPEITRKSFKKVKGEEGCLSVPESLGIVQRYKSISVKALDRNGKKIKINTDEFDSIIFQHEIDHLDGILFIDRAKKIYPIR